MTTVLSPIRFLPSLTPRNGYSLHSPMVIDEDEDDLTILNAQIAALQTRLSTLQAKRHDLIQKHILRALTPPCDEKPRVPPVTRLAPELLGIIFQLTLEAPDSSSVPQSPLTANLLSISNVCKRWRSVAQSTPQLWTHLVITPPASAATATSNINTNHVSSTAQSTRESINSLLALLTSWIPRSGALPFHLYLLDRRGHARKSHLFAKDLCDPQRSISSLCTRTIGTLYSHLNRCRYIQVDEDMTDIWNVLFSGLRSMSTASLTAPNLDTLLISCPTVISRTASDYLPSQWLDLTSRKLELPSLHTLDVTAPMALPTINGFAMDHSQLRVLKWRSRGSAYGPPGFTAFADLLAKCTNLEECEVDHFPTSQRISSRMITLPRLTKLSIKFALSEDPTVVLSMIHAPELHHLTLEQTSPISHVLGLSGAIAEFLRASTSSHGLRSLTLSGLILKDLDVPLFQALDNVRHLATNLSLVFDRCFLHETFISQIFGMLDPAVELMEMDDAGSPMPVPLARLSNLTLRMTAFDSRLIDEVVRARERLQICIS